LVEYLLLWKEKEVAIKVAKLDLSIPYGQQLYQSSKHPDNLFSGDTF
jgi:hypothetical protein